MSVKSVSFIMFSILMQLSMSGSVYAGLDDWIKKEAIPTIKGERPLKIKPYVKVTHNGDRKFYLDKSNAYIKVGDVTIKTHQLAKRLRQAGCIIETGGNVAVCAPDVLARELQNIANSSSSGSYNTIYPQQSAPSPPPYNMIPTPNLYCCNPANGMKVCKLQIVVGGIGTPCQCMGVYGSGYVCY